jgi:hypothetical protein
MKVQRPERSGFRPPKARIAGILSGSLFPEMQASFKVCEYEGRSSGQFSENHPLMLNCPEPSETGSERGDFM